MCPERQQRVLIAEQLRIEGEIRGGTLLQVRVAAGSRNLTAVFRLSATRGATVRLGQRGRITHLRVIDGVGGVHRPLRIHLSEASGSTG